MLISCSTLAWAARFDITNNCPYTVRAAAVPGSGRQLDHMGPLDVTTGTKGVWIWVRTNCRFDGAGRGSCKTSDCGGLNQHMNMDYIDMSLIEGFNVPMEFSLTSSGCNWVFKCTAYIVGQCPAALKVPGGCNGPCPVFKTEDHCCNSGSYGPTVYSRYFRDRCPDAYSYPKDDATRACSGGTNYKVVFCP